MIDSIRSVIRAANNSAPILFTLNVVLIIAVILHPRLGLVQLQNEKHIVEKLEKIMIAASFDQAGWWEVRERFSFGQFHLPQHLVEYLEIQTLKLGPVCRGQRFLSYHSPLISTNDYLFFETEKKIGDLLRELSIERDGYETIFDNGDLMVDYNASTQTFLFWSLHSGSVLARVNGIYGFPAMDKEALSKTSWLSQNTITLSNIELAEQLKSTVLSMKI